MKLLYAILFCCLSVVPLSAATRGKKLIEYGWGSPDTAYSKNYYTPSQLQTTLNHALNASDQYVWVYSERLRWWNGTAPKAYIEALALAKKGPGR